MRVGQWQTAKPVAFHLGPVITNKVEVEVSRSVPDFLFRSRCIKWKGSISSKQVWDSLVGKVLLAVLWKGFCGQRGLYFWHRGIASWIFSDGAVHGMVSSIAGQLCNLVCSVPRC